MLDFSLFSSLSVFFFVCLFVLLITFLEEVDEGMFDACVCLVGDMSVELFVFSVCLSDFFVFCLFLPLFLFSLCSSHSDLHSVFLRFVYVSVHLFLSVVALSLFACLSISTSV